MYQLEEHKDGYIVFEESGITAVAYGASEKWFPTYDEAIEFAMEHMKSIIESRKFDADTIYVYEGGEYLLHQSHSIPAGFVVFKWSNYNR